MKKQDRFRMQAAAILGLLLVVFLSVLLAEDEPIDWERARELRHKEQMGETLTEEEKAYLERAKSERQHPNGNEPPAPQETTGLVPLTELGEDLYKEQTGGLYGDGLNVPPEAHALAAETQTALIQPLDANGVPSESGTIVLISLGMSNTTQEFSTFKKLADVDPNKSRRVMLVDCAQGGQAAREWAVAEEEPTEDNMRSPWVVMDQRLEKAGVTSLQVQVVWLKQAQKLPAALGAFPAHAESLRDDVAVILRRLKARFPNLSVAYLSSRIYAGYATSALNPEPYAYESAFSVRWLIEAQVAGDPELNYDPLKGEVKAPLLLWGPYLWGDGITPRLSDGLVWTREDFAKDGTHPSISGRDKVARMLLEFFKTDANAKRWFLTESTE